jgi:hypothetical protein
MTAAGAFAGLDHRPGSEVDKKEPVREGLIAQVDQCP